MPEETVHEALLRQIAAVDLLVDEFGDIINNRQSHEAAYATLAGNLKGVVGGEMYFRGTVDPDEANPTNVDEGTFATIRDLIYASPAGARVIVKLLAGKTYPIDSASISIDGRSVTLQKEGAGVNPLITPVAYVDVAADINRFYFFTMRAGALMFNEVDITLPAKADPARDWGRIALVEYTGFFTRIAINGGVFTGQDNQSIASSHIGTIVQVAMKDTTLSGAVFCVTNAAQGVSLITQYGTTFLNGAALTDGGVRGENLLHN